MPLGATLVGRAMLVSTMDTCYCPWWLLDEFFTIFYVMGLFRFLSSIHVLLFWPAHRRQRQWHVPCCLQASVALELHLEICT